MTNDQLREAELQKRTQFLERHLKNDPSIASQAISHEKSTSPSPLLNNVQADNINPAARSVAGTVEKPEERIEQLEAKVSELKAKLSLTESALQTAQDQLNKQGPSSQTANNSASKETLITQDSLREVGTEVSLHSSNSRIDRRTDRDGFVNDEAIQKYRNARILFDSNRKMDAAIEFKKFLKIFADHPLAPSANYLVAEAYFSNNQFEEAQKEYQQILTAYPNCSYVPETLSRLATVQEKLNAPSESVQFRQMLLSLFPQSPAAQLALNQVTINEKVGSKNLASIHNNEVSETPPTAPLPETEAGPAEDSMME